jgi:hypothetical protein
MPIKSGVTFFMLVFYIAFIADYLKENFFRMGENLKILETLLK